MRKRMTAFILAVMMVLTLLPVTALAVDTTHNVANVGELTTALGNAADGDTIKLTAHITMTDGITLTDKGWVYLDLNGHTLTVNCTDGTAISMTDSAISFSNTSGDPGNVIVNGDITAVATDEFGATGGEACGLNVYDDLTVTVNGSVTAEAYDGGFSEGVVANEAIVHITGNVTATATDGEAYGVDAINATVTVGGNVTATAMDGDCYGVDAYDATVTVGGDVIATATATDGVCYGVDAYDATVTVTRGVTAALTSNGEYGSCYGVNADSASVNVTGDVFAISSGDGSYVAVAGVDAFSSSAVKVTGSVTATATGNSSDVRSVNAGDNYPKPTVSTTVTIDGSVTATATGANSSCTGVYATYYPVIQIAGDVIANSAGSSKGVYAWINVTVTVDGSVAAAASGDNGWTYGVYTGSTDTKVEVNGDITANATGEYAKAYGVAAEDGSEVAVTGNITGTANGGSGEAYGVKANGSGAVVKVSGNVASSASAADGTAYGAYANSSGKITIDGTITISGDTAIYATVGLSNKNEGEYAEQDGFYFKYTDNTSRVYVRNPAAASIDPTSKTFTATTVGYSAQTAQVFTITNNTYDDDNVYSAEATNLSATLGGTSFEISTALSDTSVDAGDSVTVSVRPKTGLSAGTYTDTLTITGDDGISLTASLSFTVNAASTYTATVSPTSKTYTAATAGYGTQTAQVFTITNTGTGQITTLSATLGGSNFEISTALSGTSINAGGTVTVSVRPKTGLSAGTYTDTLTITGSNGISLTASLSFTVNSGGGGGGGSSGGSSSDSGRTTTPETPASTVTVDGKEVNAGEVKTSGDTTTVTVNQETINKQLVTATTNVTITVPADTGTAVAQLVVQNVDDMAAKDMTLTVQVGNVQYEIPTTAIDTASILDALGTENAADVLFNITITTDMSAAAQAAVEAAITGGAELVLPPMAFTITATYNGQTVEIDTFSQYVSRSVEITAEQASRITTAIVVDPDGTTRQVPTRVYEQNGKWYAEVSSLTNSTYAFVSNEKIFADAKGKWYEAAVNEMGSRMIISGVGDNLFAGERDITRAEFAAIIVRALGLPSTGNGAVFTDVSHSAWYCGAVGAAYEYGLVSGVGDNQFAPDRKITRQEAMLMIRRAAKIAGFTGGTGNLNAFVDSGNVSDWALDAARWNVGSGLIVGSDDKLRPQDNITRAETATLVLKLLQKAGLVDVRTKF